MPERSLSADGGKIAAMTETTPADISSEGIADDIAQAIVAHRLPPGTKLREEALARVYHVSRTKIRAALLMLAKDKLIRMEQRLKEDLFTLNGIDLSPIEKTIEIGKKLVEYRANITVYAFEKSQQCVATTGKPC